jgi:hypothetical protein
MGLIVAMEEKRIPRFKKLVIESDDLHFVLLYSSILKYIRNEEGESIPVCHLLLGEMHHF